MSQNVANASNKPENTYHISFPKNQQPLFAVEEDLALRAESASPAFEEPISSSLFEGSGPVSSMERKIRLSPCNDNKSPLPVAPALLEAVHEQDPSEAKSSVYDPPTETVQMQGKSVHNRSAHITSSPGLAGVDIKKRRPASPSPVSNNTKKKPSRKRKPTPPFRRSANQKKWRRMRIEYIFTYVSTPASFPV